MKTLDPRRRQQLIWLAVPVIVLTVLALSVQARHLSQQWSPEISGAVLPSWDVIVADIDRIHIRTGDGSFTLERRDTGWVMPERDDYPIRQERLAELDAYLRSLAFDRALTARRDRLARLGLAELGEDNSGLLIRFEQADGAVLDSWMLGRELGNRLYLRRPDTPQAYAATPTQDGMSQPAIAQAGDWLELDFLELGRTRIARTEIYPETGPPYVLERASRTSRNFSLREPRGWSPITAGAPDGPGSALGRIRFRDVRSAERMRGAVVGRHISETFDGLRVDMTLIAQGETRWALLRAEALSDDARAQADELNATLSGWAYLVSDFSLDRLLRPLADFADPTTPTEIPDETQPDNNSGQ
ncbi:DUF4340 domain-containing protein [Maricaulis sp. D1M11]|uniref:DUF4340 domain-containing protein n=1 Tax=Maricaulis sp. D1M11 TaxID=3076117 RepID=UPI0039B69B87